MATTEVLGSLTLDDARDAFLDNLTTDKTWGAAADYVATAVEYWGDGMIEDQTFAQIVKECAKYL